MQSGFFEGKGDVESAKSERPRPAYCCFSAPLVYVEGDVRCIEVQRGERGVMHDR